MLADILQLLMFGIVFGSILALGAIGISVIFGILRFAHFAHGDLMTVGAYFALLFVAVLDWPVLLALPAAMALTAVAAVLIDRVLYRHFRRSSPVVLLISSFGMALVLRSLVQIVAGSENQVYVSGITLPLVIGELRIKPDHLTIVAGAVVLVAAFHLFLKKTTMGKAMRAMSDNPDLARISGIDTDRVVLWTWIIGGCLAAAAGVFLALDTRLNPQLGWNVLLPMFAAAIVGGIGRPYGAIAGGLVIGIATELSTLVFLPAYKPAVAFIFMLIVLVWRPTGIFKGSL
ncbi:MAG: branched-chain amino acid ABC transporter permease [Rhodospirillales bacterium]|jgi:branched-chain amino acid transport system permease protein/neutral amino acid transport system permease protein|nr:branched-chain amino acid ABC transporter permease [Rhodospirillales bacterium]MDP6646015.1 branched-chain amino acid ABC transporter permease [Rhodospirillales bacterium]MDP6841200.1 branched-chain amino acid ABC transporter permease [Rhodospirillales bacterium]|tara:strand:- start:2827 stop:3690 length:864 start_codon:yes stop_codon:yes gene_type:complete